MQFNFRIPALKWILPLTLSFCTALLLRSLFFETYCVNSVSMENTLLQGDRILVATYNSQNPFALVRYKNIKRNDLLVFNFPADYNKIDDLRRKFVKRCVGLPGDTFEIIAKKVKINGKTHKNPKNAKCRFRILTNSPDSLIFQRNRNSKTKSAQSAIGKIFLNLTEKEAEIIAANNLIFDCRKVLMSENQKNVQATFVEQTKEWNNDFFGKLLIPKRNQTITLNAENIDVYRTIIENHEGKAVRIERNSIYINNLLADSYTFMHNYYFFLDDNRDLAFDSRHWGFVPENQIVGKVLLLLYSFNAENSFLWNRLLSTI